MYAIRGSWKIPSNVIVNDCSLYGTTALPLESTRLNVVVPSRFPLSVNAPSNVAFKKTSFALISLVLNVSNDTDPTPRIAYTVSDSRITFAEPPLGSSVKDGQTAPGVKFYGRLFEFKTDTLNNQYLKKIRNIFQRSGTWIDAANQLNQNRAFIQSETLGYIKSEYPSFTWGTLESKCYRDIGLIVDALEHDLRFGGNEKTVAAAESYFRDGTLDYISGEISATIEAFSYAVRLCKLAMRNWDYVDRQASWTAGTNTVETSDTSNIAIGMKVSAGRAFPEGTRVTEILDSRRITVSNNSLPCLLYTSPSPRD